MDTNFEILKYTHDKHPESHLHEYYEIFISLSNDGKLFVREKGHPLQFGRVFLLNPLEIHRCFCHGNKDYDRYIIHFTRSYLQRLSTQNTNLVQLFDNAPLIQQVPGDILAGMLGKLVYLSRPMTVEFGDDIERNIEFDTFLLMMARVIENSNTGHVQIPENENRVNEILQYIHENYANNITLDVLSKQFFISKSRLSQIFKATTGFPVGDYVITYRIKQACALLQKGISAGDVGELVGFHTNTHFIRMFKRRVGCSPGRFLKNTRLGTSSKGKP